MKKRKALLIISAVACLLAVLITLGTCGGGQLHVEQAMPPGPAIWMPTEYIEDTYSACPGLQAGPVTVIADTPWGILISCHISDHVFAQWYTLEGGTTGPFEVTKAEDTETRWFFLKPGESMKVYLDSRLRTDDGTFWTFTNALEFGEAHS